MKNLDFIAEELFNKIRGRFPSVTIGNEKGEVTNQPIEARFYDFDFKEGSNILGKISISLDEQGIAVMYGNDFITNEDEITRENWFNFLKELRMFAKKRLLNFDTRNITKNNLDKRDYKFLASNRPGEVQMESAMYGTSKTSYQNIGNARIAIKHTESINQESSSGRIRKVGSIFIETSEGERFKYPYKHLNGARAMARHVSEGGNPHDDFGKHIVGLSEELAKLKKFKTYMGRSSVMAESLKEYSSAVNQRIGLVKKTLENIQKENAYKTIVNDFVAEELTEVPADVAEAWVDQLTIKQFNEELKDVFPYVYRLVGEARKAKELTFEDLVEDHTETYTVKQGDTLYSIAREMVKYEMKGMSVAEAVESIAEMNGIKDPAMIQVGMELQIPWVTGAVGGDPMTGEPITRGLPHGYEDQLENSFESMMGQFAEGVEMCPDACCGKPVTECSCGPDCPHCDCYEKNKSMNESKQDIPITEFVLSMYDRHTGQFPKGETAVLTAVEKDYGDQYIETAKSFIDAINEKYSEIIERHGQQTEGENDDFDDRNFQDELDDIVRNITPSSKRRSLSKRKVDTKAPIIDIDDMEFFYDDINEADQQTVAKLRTVQQNIQAGQAANDADAIMAAGSELGSILADEVMPEMYKFLDKFVREFEAACKEHANDPDPKWQQACKQLPTLKAELEQSKRDSMQAGMANIGRSDVGEAYSSELDRILQLSMLTERGRFEGDISQPGMYQGYIKVDKNDTRDVNGEPHAAVISVDKGWKSYQPVAEDGAVVWISKWVKGRDWVFSQLHDNGLEFSLALGGRYTRHNGRWMTRTAFDNYQDEARAGDSAEEDKAMQAGIEKVKAAGVDWDAELRKARQGNVPDDRITDEGELLNYFLQQQGEPFWDEDVNWRGGDILWNPDDDGYTYVDTSIFISAKDRETESDARDSGETAEDDFASDGESEVDRIARQGQEEVDRIARQGQNAVDRISNPGTRAVDSNVRAVADDINALRKMAGI